MHSVEGTFTTCININAPDQSSSCHIFLECWWRKLAKNQRSLPAFFLGPKAHVHDPVHVLLVGLNHMHGPMQNFLVCFGAPKLYAFPICKCYAFLNILLGYPLCLTTTHNFIPFLKIVRPECGMFKHHMPYTSINHVIQTMFHRPHRL